MNSFDIFVIKGFTAKGMKQNWKESGVNIYRN